MRACARGCRLAAVAVRVRQNPSPKGYSDCLVEILPPAGAGGATKQYNTNDNNDMNKEIIKKANSLLEEAASVIQGVSLGEGVAFLHHLIGGLLLSHKAIVAGMEEHGDFVQQMLLNIVMVHAMSPCKESGKTLEMMREFAESYVPPCEMTVCIMKVNNEQDAI